MAMEALYAFLRTIDDIADSTALSAEEKSRALQEFSAVRCQMLESCQTLDTLPDDPHIFPAFIDTVEKWSIPQECISEAIEGMVYDADFKPLETLDRLKWYCHCVAGTVGKACTQIWELNPEAEYFNLQRVNEWIEQQALAVQITNILRDIKEDAGNNRVYIPVDFLQRHAWTPHLFIEQVQQGTVRPGEAAPLIMELAAIAEGNYLSSAALKNMLSPLGQRSNEMVRNIYLQILRKIQRAPEEVLFRRISLSRWEKLRLALGNGLKW